MHHGERDKIEAIGNDVKTSGRAPCCFTIPDGTKVT